MNAFCWMCGRWSQPSVIKGWCQACRDSWRPIGKGATR